MTNLWLSNNQLSGPIPDSLGSLSSLIGIFLHDNELSGPIPDSLGSLSSLTHLSLHNNELSDPIPDSLGSLSSLVWLSLYNNELSGSIPDSLGSLSSLKILYLHNNQLSSIPNSLGSLSSLEQLFLHNNELSGSISDSLGSLSSLTSLSLSNNELSGSIPDSLGSLSSLEHLSLYNNELCGDIPLSLMDLERLRYLYLQNNHLTASDPDLIEWIDGLYSSSWTGQTPCPATENGVCIAPLGTNGADNCYQRKTQTWCDLKDGTWHPGLTCKADFPTIPLLITIDSFNATRNNNKVKIKLVTGSETNTAALQIHRAPSILQNLQQIQEVCRWDGVGTNSGSVYSCKDENAPASVVYWPVEVENDGTTNNYLKFITTVQ